MNIKGFFSNWIVRNLLLAALAVLLFVLAANLFLSLVTQHGKEIIVPDFTNLTVREASRVASAAGVELAVSDSMYIRRMKPGAVYRQSPEAGEHVKEGRKIRLSINTLRPKQVPMPSLVGFSLRQAKAELLSKGLVLGRLVYRPDLATDNVLKQMLGGTEVLPGTEVESESAVDLILGLNPSDNTTYIPYLLGMKYLNAVDAVHDNSLNVDEVLFDNTVKDYADSLNAVVYLQEPESVEDSAFVKGTGLSLYLTTDVSKVPERVEETDSTFTELTVR